MKTKNRILVAIIVLLVAFPGVLKSQIDIYVRDTDTNLPIEEVTLIVNRLTPVNIIDTFLNATDANGYFEIVEGSGSVTAIHPNYLTQIVPFLETETLINFYLNPLAPPTVTTLPVTNITHNSATSGGNVTDIGSSAVTVRGVCWSTSPNPDTSDYVTNDGSGSGTFTSNLTNLDHNRRYWIRAYAMNAEGISYGDELDFYTTCPPINITGYISHISCNGVNDGAIDITVSGGSIPYEYSWSNSASTQDLDSLSAGTYSITITDSLGCTGGDTYVVTEPPALSVSGVVTNVSCNGAVDGAINLTVTGGSIPYSFDWEHGATDEDLTGLGAGTYTVAVTDSSHCEQIAIYTITQPTPLEINGIATSPETCINCMDGSISINVSGGTPGYTYNWTGPNGFTATTNDINNLTSGDYFVTVTDMNGCMDSAHVIVSNPLIVTNTNNNGFGSLHYAIEYANNRLGADEIQFNIPELRVHTIKPDTMLPTITESLHINGFSQPGSFQNSNLPGEGFNTVLQIEIEGTNMLDPATGLIINCDSCEISGLIINRFSNRGVAIWGNSNNVTECFIGTDSLGTQSSAYGNRVFGIEIYSANNNKIHNCIVSANGGVDPNPGIVISEGSTLNQFSGNLIGTDISGTLPMPNSGSGINISDSPGNTIGGINDEDRNIIQGGIQLAGATTTGNRIIGNYIGPDVTGQAALDQSGGIFILNGASNNEVGPGNVISGNANDGLRITGQNTGNNRIFGNYFGVGADGNTHIGNQNCNIVFEDSPDNRVGGLTSDSLNVISGCGHAGIAMWGQYSFGNQIVGNYIGTNALGDQAVGNAQQGILIAAEATNNIIGPNNVISGNENWGIQLYHVTATNNRIINNFIGTDRSGTLPLDNGQAGIYITNTPGNVVDGNTICGAGAGLPGGPGIEILGEDSWNNIISNNYIGTNTDGDQGLGNGSVGIMIFMGASNNVIGPNNVIAGNGGGLQIEGEGTDSTIIFGNYIGTNQTDSTNIGNTYSGITITESSSNNTIGPNNVISGNGECGIHVSMQNSTGTRIIGNLIGTTTNGMEALGNGTHGIHMSAPDNTIGGYLEEERNVISANGFGIEIGSDSVISNNIVLGNYLGTDSTGNGSLLNTGGDLSLNNSSSNTVGGLEPGARNVIGSMAIVNKGAFHNRVIGNYIGIRADGSGPINASVERAGILIYDASDNIIGPENVISGVSEGVFITEYFGVDTVPTMNNLVIGNFIGTNPIGTFAIPNRNGLQIEAKGNQIGGFTEEERNIISGNDIGVNIFGVGADSNLVVGNYIGTDLNGQEAIPNTNGIWITDGNDNIIGGEVEEARNIISGNGDNGIWIQGNGPLIASGNKVQGNFIGIAANGTDPLGNGGFGVKINAAAGNLIGGPEPKHRNIVSANGTPGMNRFGIYIEFENSGLGNTIQGNYVGTDVTGMLDVGNISAGILVNNASNNKILDNLVSGNAAGIVLWQGEPVEPAITYETIISGNIVGLNAKADALLGNDFEGISINRSSNNTIGGVTLKEANIIGGSGRAGLLLSHDAKENIVLNNYIGLDPTNNKPYPNEIGIQIDSFSTNNQVGNLIGHGNNIAFNTSSGVLIRSGNNALFGNQIWNNGTDGIEVNSDIGSESQNNYFSQNLIFKNGELGIDLNSDGPTLNDDLPLDPDEGPNNLQNFPVLDSIGFADGKVTVGGFLRTKSDSVYIIEFFASGVGDNTTYGEGEYYLGSDSVVTNDNGIAFFKTTLDTRGYGAQVITATATDQDGNTSEFSQVIGGLVSQVLADMPFRYTLNSEGLPTVPMADYQNTIRNSFQTWDDISTAEIEMVDAGSSDAKYASATDGLNLVSFQDDRFPFAKGVLAVTAKTLQLTAGGTAAEILDADIIFNPDYIHDPVHSFAVLTDGDTITHAFDIQSVATHEIGHVLGMIHSGVYSSTMFFMLGYGTTERELDADDMAWASYRYPNANFQPTHGLISGRITYGDLGDVAIPSSHPPVAGALVLAINTDTQEKFHAYTDADGNYTVPISMEGMYWIHIQPLDGDVYGTALKPANISPYIYSHTIYTDFPNEFYDELESADDNPMSGADVLVQAGVATKGIDLITNRDLTPPTVIGVSPALGDTGIAVSPTLAIKFSEPVNIYSFDETTCYLEGASATVGGEYILMGDSTHIVLMKPVESLLYSTVYMLHIDGITDLKGNALAPADTSSFTTMSPDTLAPAVYDVIPAHGITQVDVTKPIKVFFSEAMNKSSVETGFTLMNTDSMLVAGDHDWDLANKEMTYLPDYSLQEGTDYLISLSALVTDLSGNAMEEDTTFTFSTVDVAIPQILYLGPANGSTGITVETPVVVKMSEPLDVTTITSTSFSLAGTGGSVNGTYEYLDDNRTIVFRPDQSLNFDQLYTVTLSSDISDKSDPKQYLQYTEATFRTAPGTVVPHITYMEPPFGAEGAQTAIVGSGFDPVPSNNIVLFNGAVASISKATLESLTVEVPDLAFDGPVTVSVKGVAADNSFEFDVVPPNTDPSYSVIASTTTGSRTRAVVINPNAGYAYVTNWGDNTVTPIDISGYIPVPGTDIPVGIEPMDIALNPEGSLAYVTNYLSNTVSVIGTNPGDAATFHLVTKDIPVGYHPYGVAASSDKKVYVANNESEYVSVIDVDPSSGGFDHVIANVTTGTKNRSIVVTPNAVLILVTGDNGVTIIDRDPISPTFNDVIAVASKGSTTRHVTITPDAALALATTEDGVILIIDIFQPAGTEFGNVIASVTTGSTARNITISPDAMYVYITNPDNNTVSVYQLDYSIVPGYGATLNNPLGLIHIATIEVDDQPYAIVGHPNSEYILVTHDSNTGGVSKIGIVEESVDLIYTLGELIASVNNAISDEVVARKYGDKLLTDLEKTLDRINSDRINSALDHLDNFIERVQRWIIFGKIPETLGNAWLNAAYRIREQLLRDLSAQESLLKGTGETGTGIRTLNDSQKIAGKMMEIQREGVLKLENRPNPFSYHTLINFEIPGNGDANLPVIMRVFNTSGQVVKRLVHMDMEPGRYSVIWNSNLDNGGTVPDGIYLLELMVPGQRKAITISVIR